MGWGVALKAFAKNQAKQAAVGAGKKMAGKMLGRDKKQQQQQQPPSDGGDGDEGGSLVKAGSSAIVPMGVKSSALAISQTPAGGGGGQDLEGTVLRIKTSVIKVENLLAGSAVLQEKQREDARKAKEAADAAAAEGQLEKPKDKKQKFTIPQPKIVKSFWEKMKAFFLNTFLGFITVRLLPFLDKIAPVIKLLVGIGEWVLKIAGWVFNALVTAIDWAYKLYDGARKWVGDTFGEQAVVWFDKLSGALNTLINGFIVWKLVGQKIFNAAIGAIKNAWNFAANIVKGAGRIVNRLTGGAAGRLARGIGARFNRLIGRGGRQFLRAPGAALRRGGARLLSAGRGILSRGAGAAAGRVGGLAANIFGKSAAVISAAFKAAKPFISKFFGRVPIIGPLVVGIVSLLSGEPAGQAIFKTMGAALGGFLGSFIPIPILGTLLGETVGVFVGDLLYTLMMGGGPQAAGKKLKDALMGILKAGTAVKDWIGGGISRFTESLFKVDPIDIESGWGRRAAATKIAEVLGMFDWLKGLGYVEGDQVVKFPNLLNLLNPFKFYPLLFKAFFPPGESSNGSGAGGGGSSAPIEEEDPGINVNLLAKESPGKDLLMAMNQNPTYEGVVEALRTFAPYEETVVIPPRTIKEGDGDKTSKKALFITSGVLYSAGRNGEDAYEKLYVGGLA